MRRYARIRFSFAFAACLSAAFGCTSRAPESPTEGGALSGSLEDKEAGVGSDHTNPTSAADAGDPDSSNRADPFDCCRTDGGIPLECFCVGANGEFHAGCLDTSFDARRDLAASDCAPPKRPRVLEGCGFVGVANTGFDTGHVYWYDEASGALVGASQGGVFSFCGRNSFAVDYGTVPPAECEIETTNLCARPEGGTGP